MLTEHYTTANHLTEDPFPSGSKVYVVVLEVEPATVNTIRGTVSPDGYSATLDDGRFVYLPEGLSFPEEESANSITEMFRARLITGEQ